MSAGYLLRIKKVLSDYGVRRQPSVNYAGSLGGQRSRKRKAESFRFCASETDASRYLPRAIAADTLILVRSGFGNSIEGRS